MGRTAIDNMETLTAKQAIECVVETVSKVSVAQEAVKKPTQDSINKLLDVISAFNKHIEEKTALVIQLNEQLQKVSYLQVNSKEDFDLIETMVHKLKDAYGKTIRMYVRDSWTIKEGFSANVMYALKHALDDWKEHNEDLEHKYFKLANDEEMATLSTELIKLTSKKAC